jgi:hypothetical protein
MPGQDLFIEVWDEIGGMVGESSLPTPHELVETFQGDSQHTVKKQVDRYREDHDYAICGNWNFRESL